MGHAVRIWVSAEKWQRQKVVRLDLVPCPAMEITVPIAPGKQTSKETACASGKLSTLADVMGIGMQLDTEPVTCTAVAKGLNF